MILHQGACCGGMRKHLYTPSRGLFCGMHDSGYDAVVVGGGMYGCSLALHLSRLMERVLVLEAATGVLQRASYANQARVHHGYHYPRSLLTALRSRVNFARFTGDYGECLDRSFTKYYAVAKVFSKINAAQFKTFCKRIGMPLEPAPPAVRRLFNRSLIEDVFRVEECAFDAVKLQKQIVAALLQCGVELQTRCEVTQVQPGSGGRLRVLYLTAGHSREVEGRHIFNCTYSETNRLLTHSGLPAVALKHELAELPLVEVPQPLANAGITVMDGPFFSVMPFPPSGVHTLSHVRYTPHGSWHDDGAQAYRSAYERLAGSPRRTNYPCMIRDAQRYLPVLKECRYVDSLWEIKTVLPASESDDSRPILFHRDARRPGLTSIVGGKIDNIYDVLLEINKVQEQGGLR